MIERLAALSTTAMRGPVPISSTLLQRPADSAKRFVIGGVVAVAAVGLLIGAITSLVRWLGLPAANGPGLVHAQRTQAMMATVGLGVLGVVALMIAGWILVGHLLQLRRIHRLYRFAVANELAFVREQSGQHIDGPAFSVSGNFREHSPLVRGQVDGSAFELGEYQVRHVSAQHVGSGRGSRTRDVRRTRFTYLSIHVGVALPTVRLQARRAPRLRSADTLPRWRGDESLEPAFVVRGDDARLDRLAEQRLRAALLAHADRHHVELHGSRVTLLTGSGAYADEQQLAALLEAGDAIAPAVRTAFS